MVEWIFLAITDNIFAGVEAVQKLTIKDLMQGQTKCLPGAYALKKHLLDHLLQAFGEMYKPELTDKVRNIFASHRTFREQYQAMPGDSGREPDVSFMATWPPSARLLTEFIAEAVFGHDHPYAAGFQAAAKKNLGVASLMECGAFSEKWDTIKREHAVEKTKAAAAAAIAADAAGQAGSAVCGDGNAADALRLQDGAAEEGEVTGSASCGDGALLDEEASVRAYWRNYAHGIVRHAIHLLTAPSEHKHMLEELQRTAAFSLQAERPAEHLPDLL